MFGSRREDVLVVGAGPVGLMTATVLESRGVRCRIVDAAWEAAGHSYSVALHPHTLSLLDDLNVLHPLVDEGLRIDRISFYDGATEQTAVELDELSATFPYVLILNQGLLEAALIDRLRHLGRRVAFNHSLATIENAPDQVVARVDQLEKHSSGYGVASTEWVVDRSDTRSYQFVLGADGSQSLVRRALGLPERRLGAPEAHAIFEFQGRSVDFHEVRVIIGDGTTDVLWPIPGNRWRFSFQIDDDYVAHQLSERHAGRLAEGRHQLPVEMLRELIRQRAPWFLDRIDGMDWSTVVRFERRYAEHFAAGRCILLGDAAHTSGPAGVHSLNMGLHEAHDAASLVAGIMHHHIDPSRVETYDRQRVNEWRALASLGQRFAPAHDASPWVQRHRRELLACLPTAGPSLEAMAARLGLESRVAA